MALFRKAEPEPEPPRVSSLQVLRQALRNRNARANGVAGLKEELHVSFAAIDAFINGADGALTGSQLDQAAKFIWGGHVELVDGMLRSAHREEARSVGIAPPPAVGKPVGPRWPDEVQAPRMVRDAGPAKVAAASKPGWA